MSKVWIWVLWIVGGLIAAVGIGMQLKSNKVARKSAQKRQKAERSRVKAADDRAAAEVQHAKRTGNLADHLRRDGAGK